MLYLIFTLLNFIFDFNIKTLANLAHSFITLQNSNHLAYFDLSFLSQMPPYRIPFQALYPI